MDNKLKIREICGDYALDIPFVDGSVYTIYFNSKRNAETVKHIIEVDGSKPNNDLYNYCPFCGSFPKIIVCDDEGNIHSENYINNPYSGIGFMLEHNIEDNPNCPIANHSGEPCGCTIYDTLDEFVNTWNNRYKNAESVSGNWIIKFQ